MTFPEVLDHALFGNKLDFENLFGDFPLAAALRPATPAPNLEENYTYCMALRRSTRAKTPAPSLQAQPVPQPQPAPSHRPKQRPTQPVAPANPVSDLPVLPPTGTEQRDRHVRVWEALQTVRSRPKPLFGVRLRRPTAARAPRTPLRSPLSQSMWTTSGCRTFRASARRRQSPAPRRVLSTPRIL